MASVIEPKVIWLTGLSGAGKSTIADGLLRALTNLNMEARILDGDELRATISKDLGFSAEDRKENIRRAAQLAKAILDQGKVAIVALISPYAEDRQLAKNSFAKGHFCEVYIDTPLETCIDRDPKGLYSKAIRGDIKNFTGIDAPYEPPKNPDLVLSTKNHSPDDMVQALLVYLGLTS